MPATVKAPRPRLSVTSIAIAQPLCRARSSLCLRPTMKVMMETTMAMIAYTGLENVRGGVMPSTTSRMTPPPTEVMSPSMTTPKASIPLRIPSAAPEMAKAGIPTSSRMNISVSNAYHSPPCFAREVYHFWGFISSRKRPRRWRPGRRACR